MRFRPMNRTDASRVMQHTLYMRGLAMLALAAFGLGLPDLALPIAVADIGIISVLFGFADLFVAAAIRPMSERGARKAAALGLLGLSHGGVTLLIGALPLTSMMAAVVTWLLGTGLAIMLFGASLPRRERTGTAIAEWGAGQLLLAFFLVVLHPTSATAVLHAAAGYAAYLGVANFALGVWLRRRSSVQGYAIAGM